MIPHMKLFVTETEKHLQIDEFHANNIADLRIYWQNIRDKYMGYDADFCYHGEHVSHIPEEFLSEIGAEILESCIETRLFQKNFIPTDKLDLIPVDEANFASFALLHDKVQGMYWTSERLKKDLTPWLIYMYGDSYVLMRLGKGEFAEIYALEAADMHVKKALLSQAAEYAFKMNKANVLWQIDDDAHADLELSQALGFEVCGTYVAYSVLIV